MVKEDFNNFSKKEDLNNLERVVVCVWALTEAAGSQNFFQKLNSNSSQKYYWTKIKIYLDLHFAKIKMLKVLF